MSVIDITILLAYFAVVGGIGYWSSKKSQKDSQSYFLGGSGIGWMAIGASLFASNISAEHFIGLAGSGASSGLAVGQFEWIACIILLLLGWFFVPFYLSTGVFTMPEFLERRFNKGCRNYLSAISLIAYIFTKVSVALWAGAKVLEVILGWNIYVGAIVLILATGAYTIFGGLRAVIYTDFLQAFILIGGGIMLTTIAVSQAGGLGVMTAKLAPSFWSVWQPINHPDFPWTGILFGAPILGIWYWCTDQMIVQRTLAAKDVTDARRATLFAGYLKILPVFILVLPGLAGAIIYPGIKPNAMYATMVNNLLPVGVKGLVVAALLAALMSSLSSVFNSSSTLAVMDFYKEYRPNASEKELVRAGQVATCFLVVVGFLWLPFIGKMSEQLFVYLQSVQAYISPPIAVVFLVGLLWKRVNGKGALAALISGFVLGAFRFIVELGVKGGWVTNALLIKLAKINFLHFAIILFVISGAILIIVSLLTEKPSEEKLSMFKVEKEEVLTHPANRLNIALTILLVAIVLLLWAIFSPLPLNTALISILLVVALWNLISPYMLKKQTE
ncbi:MAG: sodium:solute symporter [Candidatus Eremiobacteraeota bacterium]|nr:sodium:solute symporter [Candidatus Eremiobacteraeota bacterium]